MLPMQPLYKDDHGTVRFRANAIVKHILQVSANHGCGLNELAGMGFTNEDFEQLAQLIGYSLGGFSELSYVSDAAVKKAERQARKQKLID